MWIQSYCRHCVLQYSCLRHLSRPMGKFACSMQRVQHSTVQRSKGTKSHAACVSMLWGTHFGHQARSFMARSSGNPRERTVIVDQKHTQLHGTHSSRKATQSGKYGIMRPPQTIHSIPKEKVEKATRTLHKHDHGVRIRYPQATVQICTPYVL